MPSTSLSSSKPEIAQDVRIFKHPWSADSTSITSPRFDGHSAGAPSSEVERAVVDVERRSDEWRDFAEDTGCMYTFSQSADGERVDSMKWHNGRGRDLTISVDFPNDEDGEPVTDPERLESVTMWTTTDSQMHGLGVDVDNSRSGGLHDDRRKILKEVDLSGVPPERRADAIAEEFKRYRQDRGFVEGKSINSMHNYRNYVKERSRAPRPQRPSYSEIRFHPGDNSMNAQELAQEMRLDLDIEGRRIQVSTVSAGRGGIPSIARKGDSYQVSHTSFGVRKVEYESKDLAEALEYAADKYSYTDDDHREYAEEEDF